MSPKIKPCLENPQTCVCGAHQRRTLWCLIYVPLPAY